MDTLPTELLEMICRGCEQQSLKSLRSTCKRFVHVTSSFLFEEYYMAFLSHHVDNFDNFVDASKSERVAPYIRALYIAPGLLPLLDDSEGLIHAVGRDTNLYAGPSEEQHGFGTIRPAPKPHSTTMPTPAQKASDILAYKELKAEQVSFARRTAEKNWSFDSKDKAWRFIEAVGRLQNLMVIDSFPYPKGDDNMYPPSLGLRYIILTDPHDGVRTRTDKVTDDSLDQQVLIAGITALIMQAVSLRSQCNPRAEPITSLRLKNGVCWPLSPQGQIEVEENLIIGAEEVFKAIDPSTPSIRGPFSRRMPEWARLQKLDLKVQYQVLFEFEGWGEDRHSPTSSNFYSRQDDYREPCPRAWHLETLVTNLKDLFGVVKDLKSLKLKLNNGFRNVPLSDQEDLLTRLAPDLSNLPKLEHLTLSCICKEEALASVLSANASTLRTLTMAHCSFFSHDDEDYSRDCYGWYRIVEAITPPKFRLRGVNLNFLTDKYGRMLIMFPVDLKTDANDSSSLHWQAVRDYVLLGKASEVGNASSVSGMPPLRLREFDPTAELFSEEEFEDPGDEEWQWEDGHEDGAIANEA